MLNTLALHYFVATVDAKGFTAAAKTLGVSQSTISKMIKSLELSLGSELLIRHGKALQMTDLGKVLYSRGKEVLQSIKQLEQELTDAQSLNYGRLELGIPPMVNLLFTQTIKDFRQRYSKIQLKIFEPPGPATEKLVSTNELELGFSIAPIDSRLELKQEIIADYAIYAVGLESLLPKANNVLTLKQLNKKPLLLLNEEFGITRYLSQAFAANNLQTNIAAQSGHWDWLLSMAQAGLGIALLPEPFCERLPKELISKPLSADLRWQVVLLWNGYYLSEAAKAWLECSQPYFPGIVSILEGLDSESE